MSKGVTNMEYARAVEQQQQHVIQLTVTNQQQLLDLILQLAQTSFCSSNENQTSNTNSRWTYQEANDNSMQSFLVWRDQNIPFKVKPQIKTYRQSESYERDAVIYIIVVLLFYSVTIVTLMIKYMRKQAEDDKDAQLTQEVLQNSRRLAKQQEKMETAARLIVRLSRNPTFINNNRTSIQFQRYIERNRQRLTSRPRPSISISMAPPASPVPPTPGPDNQPYLRSFAGGRSSQSPVAPAHMLLNLERSLSDTSSVVDYSFATTNNNSSNTSLSELNELSSYAAQVRSPVKKMTQNNEQRDMKRDCRSSPLKSVSEGKIAAASNSSNETEPTTPTKKRKVAFL